MIIGDMEIRLRADLARLQRDMDSARQVVGSATAGMERAANAAKAAIASIAAGLGIQELGRMVDEYAKFTAQLKLASMSQREYAAAYADVKRISTSAQQDLQATGMLYARIANGTRELGTTQKQVASITETVNLALKVSGATASESASAQLQLSQAFAAGALRGEEFNAVNESAPRLMQALADGIGVPVGALKKMAEQGQITSQIMADVLPNALTKLREESKEIQTISGAFTVLRNNMMEFVGIQANASGAVSGVVSAISLLSNNLTLLAGVITTLAVSKLTTMLAGWGMETYRQVAANSALRTSTLAGAVASTEAAAVISSAKLAEAQANVRTAATAATLANARVAELRTAVMAAEGEVALAIATNGLIPAQTRAIALSEALSIAHAQQAIAANGATVAAGAAGAALTAQAAATGIAARAMGVLRGAMMFMGGPIGTVVTLLGVAATAWMMWSNKAKEANDKVAASTVETTAEMIGRLDKQIEKLKERNRLQGESAVNPKIQNLGEIGEADKAALQRAKEEIDAAVNGTGRFAARTPEKRKLAITNLTEEYEKALARVKEAQDEVAKSKELAFAAKNAEWQGKNGTPAQKEAYDLEQLRKEYGRVTPEMEKWVKAKHADKGSAQAVKAEATAYQNLISSIREKSAANALELQGYNTLSESQKMAIKLDAEIGAGKNKLSASSVNQARAEIALLETQEMAIEAKQQAAKWAEVEAKNDSDHYDSLRAGTTAIGDQIKQYEKQIETYGLSASAAIDMEKAKLEAKLAAGPATYAELIALDEQIAKMGKLADLARNKEGMEASTEAAKKATEDWKRAGEEINRSLTDALLRGFESGKSLGKNLVDTLKNMFSTLVLRPTISAIVNPMAGAVTGALGLAGPAQAAAGSGGGGVGSAVSGLGTLGSLTSGVGLLGAGGLGLQAGFGALMSGGFAGIGAAVSGGIAAIGAGTGASIAAGMGTIAGALGPIALGIGGAVALLSKGFGRGPKEFTGDQTLNGSLGAGGFAGTMDAAWKKKGGWFRSDKVGVDKSPVGAEFSAGLTSAYDAIKTTSADFARALGINADSIATRTQAIKIAIGKDAAANEKAVADFFVGVADTVAGELLPGIAKFQAQGEAASTTLQRLAVGYSLVDTALNSIGMSFGAVGASSLEARERLLSASGGLDAFAANTAAFQQNFLTEAERNAPVLKAVTEQLAALGLAGVDTRDEFKQAVLALDLTTEAGAKQYGALMNLQAGFAQVYPVMDAVADSAGDMAAKLADVNAGYQSQIDELLKAKMSPADRRALEVQGMDASTVALYDRVKSLQVEANAVEKRNGLQDELNQLTLTSTQQLELQRAALDENNRALFDSVRAAEAAKAANEAIAVSMNSYQDQIDAMNRAGMTLEQQRALEIASLDATVVPLAQQLHAMQDQATAASAAATALEAAAAQTRAVAAEGAGLDREFMQLMGDTAGLRKLELEALDPLNRAKKQEIYDMQDKIAKTALETKAMEEAARAQQDAANQAANAATQIRGAWQSVTDSVFDEVARIRGLLGENGGTSMADAQAAFSIKTAQARAGDQDAAKLLPGLSKSLLDLAEANSLTSLDLRRYQAQTAGSLTDTAKILSAKFGLSLPSVAVAASYMPSNMAPQLTEGMRSTPNVDNLRFEKSQGDGSAELIAEVRALRTTVASQQAVLDKISRNTQRSADTQDRVTDGGVAARVQIQPVAA